MELSYKNDPAIKAALIARMDAHAAADEIIKGTGWKNGKGCFIGCSLNDYDHTRWPEELGLPEWLARLSDAVFEGLPNADAMTFATELPRRIPVGVDLEPLQCLLAIARIDRMLTTQRDELKANHLYGVHEAILQTVAALEAVRKAHEESSGTESAALSARSAALSAARSAEWPAALSAEWPAAWQQERGALYAALVKVAQS